MRGLYIHIPFCKNICSYCDFPKRICKNAFQEDEYITNLIKEIKTYSNFINEDIVSVFIGGGTPNSLSILNLERLLHTISSLELHNIKEFTIEINPELLTSKQVTLFVKHKVNRVSLGVQTFNHPGLELLKRHHTKDDVIKAVNMLKINGINNINIDLMFGYFYETLKDVKNDLQIFYELQVPHISYYGLILEEKTKLYLDFTKKKLPALDEDLVADMYELIIDSLKSHGYHHYEISNFAKDNLESVHNQLYWKSLEYVGVGCGASGYLNHVRYTNHHNLEKYQQSFILQSEEISVYEAQKEFLLLGLRLIDGISKNEFNTRFKTNIEDVFDLKRIVEKGLLIIAGDNIKLSERGLMLGNLVFEEFV